MLLSEIMRHLNLNLNSNQWGWILIFSFFIYLSYPTLFFKSKVPIYGSKYLPHFIRGLCGLYHLGNDEDQFLQEIRNLGDVVNIPWPVAKTFILSQEFIEKVYSTPKNQLVFTPIRTAIQCQIFGSIFQKVDQTLQQKVYPAHSRAMAKHNLELTLKRYTETLKERIEKIKQKIDQGMEVDLMELVLDTVFEASIAGLFDSKFCATTGLSISEFRKIFSQFDLQFPLMLGIPSCFFRFIPAIRKSIEARQRLIAIFSDFIRERRYQTLNEADVVYIVIQAGLEDNLEVEEISKILLADFWALIGNAPYSAGWSLLYTSQSNCLPKILEEINQLCVEGNLSNLHKLPLISSCITESLRLTTSSFSIRIVVNEPFHLSSLATQQHYSIPQNSTVICATRSIHLDSNVFPDPSNFDPFRFLESDPNKNPAPQKTYAFGGGVSKCEGNHLAQAELKIFLCHFLSNFKFNFKNSKHGNDNVTMVGAIDNESIIVPSPLVGRPGLGVRQFRGDFKVGMSLRA